MSIVIRYFYAPGRYMKRMLFVLCCFAWVSCGSSAFTVRDRWEGWADDRARIYVQVMQVDPMPGTSEKSSDDETPDDRVFIRLALERAGFLSAQQRSAIAAGEQQKAFRDIDPVSAKVVYRKCDEDSCEAFVDFMFTGTAR